ACDEDALGRPVPAAAGVRQVQVDLGHVVAGQFFYCDGLGPAEVFALCLHDALPIYSDVGYVAGEPQPAAVGRNVDVLADVGPVGLEGVKPGLAFGRVAAVGRVPHERVVPRPEQGHVVAGAADRQVVALAADQQVGVR